MTRVLTLHDIAALLPRYERSDKADLAMLRDSLAAMAFEESPPHRLSPDAQPFVARAALLLGAIVDGRGAEKAASLADVGRAIASAIAARADDVASHPLVSRRAMSEEERLLAQARLAFDERLPSETDPELLGEFIAESREYAAASELALLQLERDPNDTEALATVFRAFHSIKGTAAFLGLARVAAFAHEAESLLSKVREGEVYYSRECAELSLHAVDMLERLLAVVADALAGDGRLPLPQGYLDLIDALAGFDPAQTHVPRPVLDSPLVDREERVERVERVAQESRNDGTVRIRTERVDQLIGLTQELLSAHALIANDASIDARRQSALLERLAYATGLARELEQLGAMMRTVPLRTTFSRLARAVRDASFRTGNSVSLVTEGGDLEIDRTIVELLTDPLMHLVRNAVHHGIETPEERASANKIRRGTITLTAFDDGSDAVIELSDDGQGLHRERIVAKALERGLIDSDEGMRDEDVFSLILVAGFTTAERVTEASGRGVGLDVVRRNLDALRGRIEIRSERGQGTSFVLRVPLSPANEPVPSRAADAYSVFPALVANERADSGFARQR